MTHTTKHTPGPWKAVQHPREHKWAWTIEGADGGGQSIARIGLVNDAQAVAANAHLIAAAPAMYEALSDVPLPSCNGDKAEWYARFYVWYCGARQAAIAQAEGTNR